jgi:secreted trypsin-like serine protease
MHNITRSRYDFLEEQNALLRRQMASPGDAVMSAADFALDEGAEAPEVEVCCPVIDQVVTENFASGVLIADRLVLTANHAAPERCFVRIPAANIVDGSRVDVIQVRRANVEGSLTPDLALLLLAEPVAIAPARLATAQDTAKARQPGVGVTLCGYGFTRDAFGNLSGAGIKRKRTPLSIDPETNAPKGDSRFDPAREFVAGGEAGGVIHDAEAGDSGGPAFLVGTDIVVGIVSRNAAGHKSVFTQVAAHADWIASVAKEFGIALPGPGKVAT